MSRSEERRKVALTKRHVKFIGLTEVLNSLDYC